MVLSYQHHGEEPSERGSDTDMSRQAWTRHCPRCGRWLTKQDPMAPWTCSCGWQSG